MKIIKPTSVSAQTCCVTRFPVLWSIHISFFFTARVRSTTGGYVFTLSTIWGGGGYLPSQVWIGGVATFWVGGPTFPGGWGTYLGRYPPTRIGTPHQGRYPPTRVGIPPPGRYPHQGRYPPPTRVGTPHQGKYPPNQGRYPPPPTGTAWRVLAMWWAICLLHSRRRTFFCFNYFLTIFATI